jgi:maltose alpha-D-glucosyltransferase/alpha-amylase
MATEQTTQASERATEIERTPRSERSDIVREPLWYKDAIIYELHVRAFYDSSGDGMGDFRGLTEKLDYLSDLGITAVWILPFYPSPWRDDGYDISNYEDVHSAYGSMKDFKEFLREAHKRDIKVITELVINHTSDQHPWFQKARNAKKGSPARDFYVWTDDPTLYSEARIIFKDFETSNWTWDAVAQQYFWHRFYSHQPDLNFDNPAVHKELFRVMDSWFEMGVDGMRLDAIPYLFERPGTNCENLPETHGFLKQLRAHLDSKFEGRMLLAEANQWPEETVPYFGDGDECHMGFHFPVMPRLFMSIHMEDRFPIIDILKQTPDIPSNAQWATFLRNHDELTLEMVTDEERDYMYRMYAHDPQARINLGIRRRLAPLLQNNRRKIELMNSLLFSLPGTPVLYYGDEIGMGDNIYLGDRNGVRTPMQWSGDRNAGFSKTNPQRLYLPTIVDPEYHYESLNVEAQRSNPTSLLWWTKRLIALRKRFRAFGRGTIRFLYPDNRKVLVFLREYEGERLLIVANLSRFTQYACVDMREFRDHVPVELFGLARFPAITDQPYFLTLGPHAFYWFKLEAPNAGSTNVAVQPEAREVLDASNGWTSILGASYAHLEHLLPRFLSGQRWYQGKARGARGLSVGDMFSLPDPSGTTNERRSSTRASQSTSVNDHRIAIVNVDYVEQSSEEYVLPLTAARATSDHREATDARHVILADLSFGTEDRGILHDATLSAGFRAALLDLIRSRRRLRGLRGELVGVPYPQLRKALDGVDVSDTRALSVEQSNTSMVFGQKVILKLYRRLESGTSLDLEIGRYLSEAGYRHTPAVLGAIEYQAPAQEPRTLAILQEFVPNEGDAWGLALDNVSAFMERVEMSRQAPPEVDTRTAALLAIAATEPSEQGRELLGVFIEELLLLGKRTGELHNALADNHEPSFAPEASTLFYQRSLYQSMRNQAGRMINGMEARIDRLPERLHEAARSLATHEADLMQRFRRVVTHKVGGKRIRIHGDYHLGQVIYTGNDFYITDFEGEPLRPLSERRLKRSPLRDVAGMLRSLHYVANSEILIRDSAHTMSANEVREHETSMQWLRFWYAEAAGAFLRGYFAATANSSFLAPIAQELEELLDAFLLEKAIYELEYEMNNRPGWAEIPLRGLMDLLQVS